MNPRSLSDKMPFVRQEAKKPNIFLILALHRELISNEYPGTLLSGVAF